MNRRGGRREDAGRKKSPTLAKITQEINQKHWKANHQYIYIFGKSCFLDLANGPCGGNLRKRFKLCVKANGCSVCSSERRRQQWSVPVFLIHLGHCQYLYWKKMLWICLDLFCGMNDMKAARPSKGVRLTEEGPLCSWRANYHLLFNTFTLSHTHVLCHDYCQVYQLRLHWENTEMFPIFRL